MSSISAARSRIWTKYGSDGTLASVQAIGVGLVGTGPWSERFLLPMLAQGPEMRLLGVWGRRPDAAGKLAQRFGVATFPSFEDLVQSCEAVAFCVPPAVQVELAVAAAAAGRPLLLNKPLAEDVAGAERIVRAVENAGVPTLLGLSWRVHPAADEFASACQKINVTGCEASFLSNAYRGGPFATEWRLRRGVVLDIGPHIFDLLELCTGPIDAVHTRGDPLRTVSLITEHASGALSVALLSAEVGVKRFEARLRAFGEEGSASLDCAQLDTPTSMARIRQLFAGAVRGKKKPQNIDVVRGLEIQRIISAAERSLVLDGTRVAVKPKLNTVESPCSMGKESEGGQSGPAPETIRIGQ
jgi:predicted dehydrogenase